MKKFIVLYHAPSTAMEQMSGASPEEAAKGMEAWMTWAQKCGSALLDMGSPLGNAQRVSASGSSAGNNEVVGYSMLEAESIEKAKAMLQGHPHLFNEVCKIEVHEALPLPG